MSIGMEPEEFFAILGMSRDELCAAKRDARDHIESLLVACPGVDRKTVLRDIDKAVDMAFAYRLAAIEVLNSAGCVRNWRHPGMTEAGEELYLLEFEVAAAKERGQIQ